METIMSTLRNPLCLDDYAVNRRVSHLVHIALVTWS